MKMETVNVYSPVASEIHKFFSQFSAEETEL